MLIDLRWNGGMGLRIDLSLPCVKRASGTAATPVPKARNKG